MEKGSKERNEQGFRSEWPTDRDAWQLYWVFLSSLLRGNVSGKKYKNSSLFLLHFASDKKAFLKVMEWKEESCTFICLFLLWHWDWVFDIKKEKRKKKKEKRKNKN